ncbi:hypothetical protein ACFL5O_05470 [Myxococcota bacterium]
MTQYSMIETRYPELYVYLGCLGHRLEESTVQTKDPQPGPEEKRW